MLFQSQEFILFLLPLSAGLYYALAAHKPAREAVLVLASLTFYGWWDVRFLPLLLGHCLVAWAGPRLTQVTGRRLFIDLAIFLQLTSLALFKYINFIVANLEQTTGSTLPRSDLILPIGISFFTFQIVSYLMDVRRKTAEPYPLRKILMYVCFFPQLVAGPIIRHNELLPQFERDPLRPGVAERFGKGFTLFVIGTAKKVLLADNLAPIADPIFAAAGAGTSFGEAWTGSLAFTFQLFLDFAAYSEMAIGLGLMFGIYLPENFRVPYLATDLRDFWRRWHITLSSFLRDYLYIPLGGNRHGPARYVLAAMLTMAACGLWHGAGWTFVVWGLMHGAGLVVCAAYRTFGWPLPIPLAWLLTQLFVVVGWVIFRSQDFGVASDMLAAMAGFNGFTGRLDQALLIATAAAVSLLVPASHDFAERWLKPYPGYAILVVGGFAYLVLQVGREPPLDFIYFQF